MKCLCPWFAVGLLLTLVAINANAQVNPGSAPSVAGSDGLTAIASIGSPTASPSGSGLDLSEPQASSGAEQQRGVKSVFQGYNWEGYFGYTFVRFYAAPGLTANRNGFNYSMQYYYKRGWFAGDGELVATFGSLSGNASHFLMGLGGPRVRWTGPLGIELWGHGLVGVSHFSPRTVYGNQDAFGYEAGGGVDINTSHRRLAYRIQADMVGTRFYNANQYSPKISAGLVFKF